MRKIRITFFYLFFYTWTIMFFIIFSPVKFFTRSFVVKLSNLWSSTVNFLCKNILGVSVCVKGKNNIPSNRSILVASNHQSAWETFFLLFSLMIPFLF